MIDKLILGTVQFGVPYGINNNKGQIEEKDVFDILDLSKKCGINSLDSAAAYGNSEQLIGKYLDLIKNKELFKINTKLGKSQEFPADIILDQSLKRLKVNKVDTLMFHSLLEFKKKQERDLERLLAKRNIKFNNLGISVYTNEEVDEVLDLELFTILQVPYNILDNHNQRGKTLTNAKLKGVEVHIRSIFLQGLFFMRPNRLPLNLRPLEKYIHTFNSILQDYKISKESLALQYALDKPYIDKVLIGVDSVNHLLKNINALKEYVPKEAIREIDNIWVQEVDLLNPSLWKL